MKIVWQGIFSVIVPISLSNCKSVPAYRQGSAIVGFYIERDGFGKIGRMSENVSLVNLDSNQEYPSNPSGIGGFSSRNRDPFTVVVVPPGRYTLRSVGLDTSLFVCRRECREFVIEIGKVYYGGSYAVKVSSGLGTITHAFAPLEPEKDKIEEATYYDNFLKSEEQWYIGKTRERLQIFVDSRFEATCGTL